MKKNQIFKIEKDENKQFNHIFDWMNNPKIPVVNLTAFIYYSYQKIYHRIYLQARIANEGTRMIFNDIINILTTYVDIKLVNHSISYYIQSEEEKKIKQEKTETYFYIGKYPLEDTYLVEIPQDGIVKIKLRPIIDKRNLLRFELYEDENEAYNNNVDLDEVKKIIM